MKELPSRRDRKKAKTRQALLEVSYRQFHLKGFDATTIDDLCEAADVSRRTFFRYFSDKDALVFPNRGERLKRFLKFLDSAPADESPYDTLRRAAQLFAHEYEENREQVIAQQALIKTSANLQAREREIDRDWEKAMAATFLERAENMTPEAELRARVVAGASMGVIRATMRYWFESGGRADLSKLGQEALDCLERGFPLE